MSNVMKDIGGLVTILAIASGMFWAGVIAVNCGQAEPDMSVVQGHSPVNIGDDEGRLEASRSTPDSILVACLRDPNQPAVHSRGRKFVGSHVFEAIDRTLGGGCERTNTHEKLNQHWLTQGGLQSQVSNH